MKTYTIEVRELLAKVVKIKAESEDAALSSVQDMYNNSVLVLDYNDLADLSFVNIGKKDKKPKPCFAIIENTRASVNRYKIVKFDSCAEVDSYVDSNPHLQLETTETTLVKAQKYMKEYLS